MQKVKKWFQPFKKSYSSTKKCYSSHPIHCINSMKSLSVPTCLPTYQPTKDINWKYIYPYCIIILYYTFLYIIHIIFYYYHFFILLYILLFNPYQYLYLFILCLLPIISSGINSISSVVSIVYQEWCQRFLIWCQCFT